MSSFLQELAFLPDSINSNLRMVIYFMTVIHMLALSCWICAFIPSLFKSEDSFEK